MKINIKQISSLKYFPNFLVCILTICGAIGMFSYYNSSEVLKASVIESMEWRTEDNADLISQNFTSLKTIIEGVAVSTKIRSMDWATQRPVLIDETKRLNVKRFQVVDLYGLAYSTSGDTIDLSDREWVKQALKGSTYISKPFLGRIDNQIIFVCATPIKNEIGEIIGGLGASMDPQLLFDIIRNIKVGKTGYGYIIDKEGTIIAHPNKALILANINNFRQESNLNLKSKEITSGNTGNTLYMLEDYKCSTYTPIPNTDWILVLSAPSKEVFNEIDVLKYEFLLLTLITIVIAIFSYFLLIEYILKRKTIIDLEKHVEEDKRLLRESAEIENIRIQFFSNISHEFRTPLNVILSSLQLFKLYYEKENALLPVNSNKHLRTMKQNCYRLLRLVNNLIDSTRIDVGFLQTHMQNYNIVKIIEDITMSIVEFTEMKGISLLFDTNIEEKIITCDVDKIERIILNLLSNAIKFTDYGGNILVSIFDKGESIVISVKDTGIGIQKDKQEMIFERFVQVEETLTRNHEGSGIGLSLAKAFVEMHGGNITLDSERGKGSEFIIELPTTILKSEDEYNNFCEVDSKQRIEKINIEFSDIYTS